eukprot:TRINITY_DN1726_c0_g1_i1.p1 TRINITY_DN1726_c0_g1~~TRINITY_DN1726_c0_g1_i1.p1  ORF type:complete len:256 (-),score=67.74 TRINITY_DN1726_c0_g1_i1:18-785(-)
MVKYPLYQLIRYRCLNPLTYSFAQEELNVEYLDSCPSSFGDHSWKSDGPTSGLGIQDIALSVAGAVGTLDYFLGVLPEGYEYYNCSQKSEIVGDSWGTMGFLFPAATEFSFARTDKDLCSSTTTFEIGNYMIDGWTGSNPISVECACSDESSSTITNIESSSYSTGGISDDPDIVSESTLMSFSESVEAITSENEGSSDTNHLDDTMEDEEVDTFEEVDGSESTGSASFSEDDETSNSSHLLWFCSYFVLFAVIN